MRINCRAVFNLFSSQTHEQAIAVLMNVTEGMGEISTKRPDSQEPVSAMTYRTTQAPGSPSCDCEVPLSLAG